MTTHTAYANKASLYARYRWDYAPAAIQAILDTTGIGPSDAMADIGAGTGILTRHFAGKVGRLYTVEADLHMLHEAQPTLNAVSNCLLIAACAEATGLPTASLDLLTVAQAIHWFEPVATRVEFRRILKPGGWLALLRNYPTDHTLGSALNAVMVEQNGVAAAAMAAPPYPVATDFYFGNGCCEKYIYPFSYYQDWEQFFGGLCSASYAPDPDHPAFPRFEKSAREVFDAFSQDGRISAHAETELVIGQPLW